MNQINKTSYDINDKVIIDINSKPKGRYIPVSKAVSNWPNTRLPWKWSKYIDLTPPYVYCSRSYKWLSNAFSKHGLFKIDECHELAKFIKIYNKWSAMKQKTEIEEQISKDIVRTFPNNIYFEKNNSGYYSMFKVLSAYSNLNEMVKNQEQRWAAKLLCLNHQNSSYSDSTGHSSSPNDRKIYRHKRNKKLRYELIDSFWELSFEDSTHYVQGMNFIVGILSYHLSPELAFSLFLKLMKDYDVEDNYAPGLIGFKEKSAELNIYMIKHLPELNQFLVSVDCSNNIIGKAYNFHRDVYSRNHHGPVWQYIAIWQLSKLLI